MFFNNFVSGPAKPANYSQPNVAAPVNNPAIGKPLPVPANTAAEKPNYVQPDYRKPSVAAGVASYPVKNANVLQITGPQPKADPAHELAAINVIGRGVVAGVIPPGINAAYLWQKG
jgi:hypothetical protein